MAPGPSVGQGGGEDLHGEVEREARSRVEPRDWRRGRAGERGGAEEEPSERRRGGGTVEGEWGEGGGGPTDGRTKEGKRGARATSKAHCGPLKA